jgi:predicted amidohydrolase
MKIRIAVMQPSIARHDIRANMAKTEKMLKRIGGKADIALFPEQFLTGPVGSKVKMLDYEKNYLSDLAKLAKRYGIDMAFGLIVKNGGAKKAANRAYYIDRQGRTLASYTKSNLWPKERKQVERGTKASVFKTRFGKVSLILCWDMMDGALLRKIKAKRAEIILCPSLWWRGSGSPGMKYDGEFAKKFVDALCTARAYENNAVIAFSNAAGTIRFEGFSDESIGNSQVTAPFAGILAKKGGNREGIAIAAVDTKILKEAKEYLFG